MQLAFSCLLLAALAVQGRLAVMLLFTAHLQVSRGLPAPVNQP